MNAVIAVVYFFTLFLSLASLLRWCHRRQAGPRRLRRGLRAYVESGSAEQQEWYPDPAIGDQEVGMAAVE
ncbi:MAG TPA: hypothetical protein VGS58_17200 [Candidatus Sulfopaludibacter sp.]|nr:hypothetical protein [Candidatus Sulfopaludibacter sp.]